MAIALEIHGLVKRFVAGAGSCLASADALRCVDLEVYAGDAVAVVGGQASGKSTLLLCAAGLIAPDGGVVRWFGNDSRACGAQRATYHFADPMAERGRQPRHASRRLAPHIHLVDGPESLPAARLAPLAHWVERRCARGDAIVVATKDAALASRLASRTVLLRAGRAYPGLPSRTARVAERAARLEQGGGAM